jgi:hypothetical protein
MSILTSPRAGDQRNPARLAHGICRLTLTINSIPYRVSPIPIAGCIGAKLYRLKSDGAHHTVAETIDGHSCDCSDPNRADCEHVRAMVACGLFDRKGGAR